MVGQLTTRLESASMQFLGAIPRDETLASIRLDEVLAGIGAKVRDLCWRLAVQQFNQPQACSLISRFSWARR